MNACRYCRSNDNQRRFAWAKYYEMVRNRHHTDYLHYNTIVRLVEQPEFPVHIKNELIEMKKELKKTWECPICMEFINEENLEITPCGHFYCKGCLTNLKAQEDPKCAICRKGIRTTPGS